MATAVGAAALLYYALKRQVVENASEVPEGVSSSGTVSTRARVRLGLARHAPSTWFEAIATLSETLRFTYSETLGKWPIADLAFGINFLMKRQVLISSHLLRKHGTLSWVCVESDEHLMLYRDNYKLPVFM
jgi:hypothetical protein